MGSAIHGQVGLDCVRTVSEYKTGSKTAGSTPPWALFSVPTPISALASPDEGL